MNKFWEVLKKWGLAIISFIAGLFLLAKKPRWIEEKEREIKDRDKEIEVAKKQAGNVATTYEEVKEKHDEAIKQGQSGESSPSFTDPDSAASFIDGVLDKRK